MWPASYPWQRELAALKGRVGLCVRRPELRTSIGHYLDGLLSGIEHKIRLASGRARG
jgi:hypothetical protein